MFVPEEKLIGTNVSGIYDEMAAAGREKGARMRLWWKQYLSPSKSSHPAAHVCYKHIGCYHIKQCII